MHIFDKRPLSLILCIMLGGFVFFERGGDYSGIFLLTLAVILISSFLFSLLRKKRKIMLLISGTALLASLLLSYLYFDLWFYADTRFKGEVTVTGTIIEEDYLTSYSSYYVIQTDNIDSQPLSNYKLEMYLDRDESESFTVGSVVSFKCNIDSFKNDESAAYRYADGVSAICENISDIEIHDEERFVIEDYFSTIRQQLTRHAISLSDKDSGTLLSALLFGERDSLSEQVRLDFKRIGITHILALSGMHLAILSFGIEKILSLFKIKKGYRVAATAVLSFLYMLLTGFPASVCRAGIMLILSSVLYFLSRDNDGVTSLFISVCIILIFAPYLIYDISLWLSAFATLGVIIYSEWREQRPKIKTKKKLVTSVTDALAFSAFAITPTLFITHFTFDGISILSPIATPIFSVLVEIIMYLGMVMLIIGSIIPINIILSPIVKLTTSLASLLSSLNVYVSKDYPIAEVIVILLSVLFFLFVILKIKRKKAAVFTILAMLCSLYIVVGGLSYIKTQDDTVRYIAEEKSDSFIIRSNGKSSLISSSQYSRKTGYNSVDSLVDLGITSLDTYYLTHLSKNLEEDLTILLSNIPIKEVYLPEPQNDDEKTIVDKLENITSQYHTELIMYNEFSHIKIGDFEIIPVYSVPYGEDTSQNAFFIHGADTNILYLSSGMMDGKASDLSKESIKHASNIIFGSHGKRYKNPIYLEAEFKNLESITINSENLFLTQEAAIDCNEKGCEINSHPKSIVLFD